MSTKSLGTLTLDLIARIGGFTAPMDQAARKSKKAAKDIEDSGKQAGSAWKSLAGIVGGAIAGISVGAIFSRMITETKNASAEQAQLAAVLKSTGQAAGFTQDQLNGMADSMESVTAISAGDITNAQIALLAFTGIVGDQLPRALQAAADMSARTGMDIKSSAETIGRALDVPSKGMAALSRQGFRFTDSQKEVIKQLEATGRTAEAQGIILNALEETYGGAAIAARGTLGGAFQALNNTIDGLLTDDSGLPGVVGAVENLNTLLGDDGVKQGLSNFTGGLIGFGTAIVNFLAGVGNFTSWAGEELAAMVNGIAPDDIVRLEQRADQIKASMGTLWEAFSAGGNSDLFTSREELQKELDLVNKMLEEAYKVRDSLANTSSSAPSGPSKREANFYEYNNKNINSGIDGDIDARIKQQNEITRAFEAQAAALERANALSAEASELEKVRYEITNGSLIGVNSGQQKRLEDLATERDLQIQLAEEEKKRIEQRKELEGDLLSVQQELRTEEEAYQAAAAERLATLNDAREAGLISEQEYGQLVIANTEKLDEQIEKLKEKTTEMDEFTKNAARSIQSSLSDAVMAGFDGGASDLLDRWKDMLKRMVADAIAADLTRALFGQGSTGGGQYGTTELITGLGGLFAGFFDAGGNIPAGRYGIVGEIGPEIVRGPAVVTGRLETEKQLGGGGGITIGNMNFPGVTNAQEARKAAGAAGRELLAVISGAQRYT